MSAPQVISVVLVNRYWLAADGLGQVLHSEADIDVLGTATNLRDGMKLIARHHPHVVVMDECLSDGDGYAATRHIAEISPESKVLLLAVSVTRDVLAQALRAGTSGVLSRDRPCQDMIDAVRTTTNDHSFLAPEYCPRDLNDWLASTPSGNDELTVRELEILRLLARAQSTKEIARNLDVSVHTVKNHSYNIFLKFGAHSRMEAIAIAIERGILEPSDIGALRYAAV